MNRLLTVIPIWADNAAQAEKLIDFIYQIIYRQASGHALLAIDAGVHAEMRERLKISASLAFEGVQVLEVRPLADKDSPKAMHVANAFRQVAAEIRENFAASFLWLEPDCVPLVRDWMHRLESAYEEQPKLFMGTLMKTVNPDPTKQFTFMARVGVYPPDTLVYIKQNQGPFELANAATIVPKMTGTKLIQQSVIHNQHDLTKLREDAILLHGDKAGLVLQHSIEKHAEVKVESKQPEVAEAPQEENVIKIPVVNGEHTKRKRRTKLEMFEARKNGSV